MLYNGNWTEWSAIWAEIIRVISKSNERAARVRFEITSMISDQNCTTRGSITTLLHPFWNHPNTGLGQFEYFIDAVLSRFLNKKRNRKCKTERLWRHVSKTQSSVSKERQLSFKKFEKSSITQKNSEALKFSPRRLTQWCKLFVSSVVGVENSGCL